MKNQPIVLVVLGISGDLSHRYLLPALAEIKKARQLPPDFKVLGISRRQLAPKDVYSGSTRTLSAITEFLQMDFSRPADYHKLKLRLKKLAGPRPQIIFYFAVPPDATPAIIGHLGAAGLNGPNVKLLLEKPFGTDLSSARKLVRQTAQYFKEGQVYRIDHYVAKEVAQNISIFLGSNVLFRKIWDKEFIDYIEIVAAEAIGLEGRGNFYEKTGALRDIVQSHLLQLAALTLMEPCPDQFDFSELPKRRLEALRSLVAPPPAKLPETVFRAQYKTYRQEIGNPDSVTETFVALQLHSMAPRWRGVPVYLATGKKLDQKLTQIRINFKKTSASHSNALVIRLQPREGIELDLWVKRPGYDKALEKKTLSFSFAQNFDHLPNAYEQVLVDAIRSDQSLFTSSQEVLASWKILQPILDFWQQDSSDLQFYKPGSSVAEVLGEEEVWK
jgi:glucose-6-phosphate 1-dehydrogenase